ncbi:FtsK/SpoIIIE domain-containing protein [Streptomyces tirandamycinicus]|uniref:FtsK/SpoIIIE domain-containing protein n=1 Tax=Streptomyces tirandamycinicus TaxID=2174846 RepID=UPI0022721EE6|nr:FtsK/SpoIIIE domain-containing protein [Streptomyces tirandamycinicus]MCY0984446.1 FtsK/SpoIIIE domain-containing protein [Streptomyces tirandamycinicus]
MSAREFLIYLGLVLVASGLLVLRRRRPAWYWYAVGAPAKLVRIVVTYRSVMEACGLTEPPSRFRLAFAATTNRTAPRRVPRLARIRFTASGLVLRIRMQPGQEVHDFETATERLRHSWRAYAVHVSALTPGWLQVKVVGYDVLRKVVMPKSARPELLSIPVAMRSDGAVHTRDFRTVPHELVMGATLSGKSVYLRGLLAGLAPQPVALVGIDCKWGVELAPFAPRLSALACTPEEAAELLDALVAEMTERYELIRSVQRLGPGPVESITSDIWGLPEDMRPVPVVVFVDEVAELFLTACSADEKRRDQMVTQLVRLAQLGRAAGLYLEVCGQRFGAELGKGATALRAQLTGRISHRVNDETTAKMALGDISPLAVLAATAIAPEQRGVAVAGDSSGGWSLVRSPFTELADAVATCTEHADLTPDLPGLAAFRPVVPALAFDLVADKD